MTTNWSAGTDIAPEVALLGLSRARLAVLQ
jgi:hypothetical protein